VREHTAHAGSRKRTQIDGVHTHAHIKSKGQRPRTTPHTSYHVPCVLSCACITYGRPTGAAVLCTMAPSVLVQGSGLSRWMPCYIISHFLCSAPCVIGLSGLAVAPTPAPHARCTAASLPLSLGVVGFLGNPCPLACGCCCCCCVLCPVLCLITNSLPPPLFCFFLVASALPPTCLCSEC
jgi:hypothetical protein